ncbi:stalk domain-containing protein [Paenibacillus guangzhouensis]|uniref:stalk domain-containing protein n=1 Tax=Paenibacillus guangzhouensis TaxID=1473112 RepID=UPI001266A36D|nr:stalk domain-containing protein [Paenibacillus guangzhouensis]
MFKRKSIRHAILLSLSLSMLFVGLPTTQIHAASAETRILLDGYDLPFSAAPTVIQGSTMVPFRSIAEALNISVEWNPKAQTITAKSRGVGEATTVILTLNKKQAVVNGEAVNIPIAPIQMKGSVLVPLSFFSKQFGAGVAWDAGTRQVLITSPQQAIYRLGFYAISSFAERSYVNEFDGVAFGWARIQEDGTVTTSGKDFYWPKASGDVSPESIVTDAASGGVKPSLMVFAGDRGGELTKMIEDDQLREKAITDIVALARDKGFGGITLDFEGLGLTGDREQAKQSYTKFVKQLAEQTGPAGLQLSLALHPLNSSYQGYDYKALGKVADELIIMAYAYEGEKGPEPLKRVDDAIKLAMQETSKDKLLLGISMGSENEQSISSKIGLAKRYDLKGIAIWRIGLIGDSSLAKMNESTMRASGQ